MSSKCVLWGHIHFTYVNKTRRSFISFGTSNIFRKHKAQAARPAWKTGKSSQILLRTISYPSNIASRFLAAGIIRMFCRIQRRRERLKLKNGAPRLGARCLVVHLVEWHMLTTKD